MGLEPVLPPLFPNRWFILRNSLPDSTNPFYTNFMSYGISQIKELRVEIAVLKQHDDAAYQEKRVPLTNQ